MTKKSPEILKEGATAPEFSLFDKEGRLYSLKSLTASFVVLFFYPKDNTPGCTIEAKGFSASLEDFETLGATLVGISGGDNRSKEKFCKAHALKMLLLSDSSFSVAKSYGIYGEKKFMGRTYLGIFRTTFILDKKRTVVRVFENVKPEGHPEEVLAVLKELKSAPPKKKKCN